MQSRSLHRTGITNRLCIGSLRGGSGLRGTIGEVGADEKAGEEAKMGTIIVVRSFDELGFYLTPPTRCVPLPRS